MAKKTTKQKQYDEFGLTRIERVFADEFILTGEKKAAAMKAGVKEKNAGVYATRMLKNVKLQQYLAPRRAAIAQKLETDYNITRDVLIRELAAIVLWDPAKMYDENGELLPLNKVDEMTRRSVDAFDKKEITNSDGDLIGYTTKIKRSPKIAAIELLGRHLRMWNEKDGGQGSILNIQIYTDRNLLDNPEPATVIENGAN